MVVTDKGLVAADIKTFAAGKEAEAPTSNVNSTIATPAEKNLPIGAFGLCI